MTRQPPLTFSPLSSSSHSTSTLTPSSSNSQASPLPLPLALSLVEYRRSLSAQVTGLLLSPMSSPEGGLGALELEKGKGRVNSSGKGKEKEKGSLQTTSENQRRLLLQDLGLISATGAPLLRLPSNSIPPPRTTASQPPMAQPSQAPLAPAQPPGPHPPQTHHQTQHQTLLQRDLEHRQAWIQFGYQKYMGGVEPGFQLDGGRLLGKRKRGLEAEAFQSQSGPDQAQSQPPQQQKNGLTSITLDPGKMLAIKRRRMSSHTEVSETTGLVSRSGSFTEGSGPGMGLVAVDENEEAVKDSRGGSSDETLKPDDVALSTDKGSRRGSGKDLEGFVLRLPTRRITSLPSPTLESVPGIILPSSPPSKTASTTRTLHGIPEGLEGSQAATPGTVALERMLGLRSAGLGGGFEGLLGASLVGSPSGGAGGDSLSAGFGASGGEGDDSVDAEMREELEGVKAEGEGRTEDEWWAGWVDFGA